MPAAVPPGPAESQPVKPDWRNISKKKPQQKFQFRGIDGNYKPGKLPKPFSRKARRIITKKTEKLIKKRNKLDRELLEEIQRKKLTPNDWLPRDKLLRRQAQLEKREERHIRKRTRKLAEVERLYTWDPSADRAVDYDLIRYLLWKFKRHLGPLIEYHHGRVHDNDASSSGTDSDSDWEDVSDREDGNGGPKHGKKRKRETGHYNASKKRVKTTATSEEAVTTKRTKSKEKSSKDARRKKNNFQSDTDMEQASDN